MARTWPLLAPGLVHSEGEKAFVRALRAQAEAPEGEGVVGTPFRVVLGVHQNIPVDLVDIARRGQHRVPMAPLAEPDALALAAVLVVKVCPQNPVLHRTARRGAGVVEVFHGMQFHFVQPIINLPPEDVPRNRIRQLECTPDLGELNVELLALWISCWRRSGHPSLQRLVRLCCEALECHGVASFEAAAEEVFGRRDVTNDDA
mmetsp:Transcript_108014/g.322995  ORF Transcript_108014/g.322995 Transcript_108014/m.322995 type:complete len:203 (+) Transcript_108014:484-1092(+)